VSHRFSIVGLVVLLGGDASAGWHGKLALSPPVADRNTKLKRLLAQSTTGPLHELCHLH
jgi:hypothetical protein